MLKVYNLSSIFTVEFERGLFLEPILNTSNGINAYFCSRNHGVSKPESFCGSYLYEELQFNSTKEIVGKRDYEFLVLDGSAVNSNGTLAFNAMLETFHFDFSSSDGVFWVISYIV